MDYATTDQRAFDFGTVVYDADEQQVGYIVAIHGDHLAVLPDLGSEDGYRIPRDAIAVDGAGRVILNIEMGSLQRERIPDDDRATYRPQQPDAGDGGLRYLPTGTPVIDTDGDRVGTIRAVYPHFIAVSGGEGNGGFRVPHRAIEGYDGQTVTLRVQKDALDPMSAQESAAEPLPHHGGQAAVGTGTSGPNTHVADHEAQERALADSGDVKLDETAHVPGSEADSDVGAAYGTDAGN